MKREPRSKTKVFKSYPLFSWVYCDNCRKEFRRMWGWRHKIGPNYNSHWVYLCSNCTQKKEDAQRMFRRVGY